MKVNKVLCENAFNKFGRYCKLESVFVNMCIYSKLVNILLFNAVVIVVFCTCERRATASKLKSVKDPSSIALHPACGL